MATPDFKAVFEAAPYPCLVLTPDLVIDAVSDSYLRATMTTRDGILGRGLFDVFPENPDDPHATWTRNLRASLNRVLQNGVADTMAVQEYGIRRPEPHGGRLEERCWSPSNTPVFGPDKKLAFIIHQVEDVTERIRADKLFHQIVESSPTATVVVDHKGKIVLVNAQAEKLFLYPRQELIGRSVSMLVPARCRDGHDAYVAGFLARPQMRAMGSGRDLFGQRKDGKEIPMEIGLNPIETSTGRLVLASIIDLTDRKALEKRLEVKIDEGSEALTEQRRFLRKVLDMNPNLIFSKDRSGRFTLANTAVADLYGTTPENIIGKTEVDFNANKEEVAASLRDDIETMDSLKERIIPEERVTDARGKKHWLRTVKRAIVGKDGVANQILSVATDITQSKQLEDQLLQAQKMEAIGRLAGGVAHDFNNILTSVLGFSDFLLKSIPQGDPRREDAAEIKTAAQRAAALTRQLLVFSRQQVFERKVLDAGALVANLMKMLQRVVGEDVALDFRPGQEACRVDADAGQLEQVVMNLVVNARDVTPSGGRIVIAADRVTLGDEAGGIDPALKPGPYAVLSVSDTGIGMDEETLKRVFEPFFTTKGPGKGTGLGLSTVYGIARHFGGAVTVKSAPGKGAVFKVWLPSVEEAPLPAAAPSQEPADLRGKATILILEDDTQIRKLLGRALGSNGYRVLEAATSQEAIDVCSRERGIDLLLSDVILSDAQRGPEAAAKLRALEPRMRIVFMSGYTDDRVARGELMSLADAFIQKPVAPDALALKVREVLDSPPRAAGRATDKGTAA